MNELIAEGKYNSNGIIEDPTCQQELNEFLYQNLILPYASFILKSLSHLNRGREKRTDIQKLWASLNSFYSLLKMQDPFYIALRYYREEIGKAVMMLVEIIDYEISGKYPHFTFVVGLKL